MWQMKESDPQPVQALVTILNTVCHVLSRSYPRTCKRCDMRVENTDCPSVCHVKSSANASCTLFMISVV